MGTYTHYIIPPQLVPKKNQFSDLRRFLDVKKFLSDAEVSERSERGGGGGARLCSNQHNILLFFSFWAQVVDKTSKRGGNLVEFLRNLCETQMFSVLVQQVSERASERSSGNENE